MFSSKWILGKKKDRLLRSVSAVKNGGLSDAKLEILPPTSQLTDILEYQSQPLYKNKEFLHQKYVTEGLSLSQIAKEISSSKDAVRSNLKRMGVELREKSKPHGRPSQIPFGKKKRNGGLVENMAEMRIVKAVMELHEQGVGYRAIARFLTEIKVPTKCRGKKWHPEMIKRIIERYK